MDEEDDVVDGEDEEHGDDDDDVGGNEDVLDENSDSKEPADQTALAEGHSLLRAVLLPLDRPGMCDGQIEAETERTNGGTFENEDEV